MSKTTELNTIMERTMTLAYSYDILNNNNMHNIIEMLKFKTVHSCLRSNKKKQTGSICRAVRHIMIEQVVGV